MLYIIFSEVATRYIASLKCMPGYHNILVTLNVGIAYQYPHAVQL